MGSGGDTGGAYSSPLTDHLSSLFIRTLPPKITAGGKRPDQVAGALVVTDLVLVVKV